MEAARSAATSDCFLSTAQLAADQADSTRSQSLELQTSSLLRWGGLRIAWYSKQTAAIPGGNFLRRRVG